MSERKFTMIELAHIHKKNPKIKCPICKEIAENDVLFAHKILMKCKNKDCPMIRFVLHKRIFFEKHTDLYSLEERDKK